MLNRYVPVTMQCLGRNFVKIPSIFMRSSTATGIFKPKMVKEESSSFGVSIIHGKLSPQEFETNLLKRRIELKDKFSTKINVLRLEKKLSETATLFRVQQIEDAYRSELRFMRAGNMIIVTIDSYRNSFLAEEQRLIEFMSQISEPGQGKNQGFCLGELIVSGDFQEESGSFLWKDGAGNTFDIDINTYVADDPTPLLKRISGPDSLLNLFNIGHTVLRARDRTVSGMPAQEWLGWTNLGEHGDEKTFKFTMETMRPPGGKTSPSMQVTFDSAQQLEDGSQTKTNLSDNEAMAIWDKVIDSIHPAQ